ncbi:MULTISPECIES: hypothetical protein [Bacillus]|nr:MULTISPECIES: hypothetical protein [Bacillus]KUL16181.1 hypothetical protein LI6934_16820 [Bacillus licheniformis LMG 6934]MCU4667626.1 hypothetical protein [Bacillus paralicheniformis]MEC0552307.1 hypothetical protein [Bacillus haynesii]MEC0633414.1 hypothetical protein [Bacillus haynesii]MEC1653496.1 hypothetical protein [Bacillus haynesii]
MKKLKKNTQRKPEKFTERDLRNLMDTNKPIYKRAKGGAFRQR